MLSRNWQIISRVIPEKNKQERLALKLQILKLMNIVICTTEFTSSMFKY